MRKLNESLKRLRRLAQNESGQGMTEYIIIVALIAILSIGFVSAFGENIRGLFAASSTALSGKEGIRTDEFVHSVSAEGAKRGLKDFDKYHTAQP